MKAQKAIKRVIKALKYVLYSLLFIVIALLIIGSAKPLWHYIVTYPALEKEIAEFKLLRKETTKTTKQNVYRGVMHVHSYLSHDSEGNLNDLIPAAKNNGIDFIFLTDHPRYQLDSFPSWLSWKLRWCFNRIGKRKTRLHLLAPRHYDH